MDGQCCEGGAHGKGRKAALLALGMVLLAGVVIVSLTREAIVRDRMYSVSVNGTGKVEYVPDIAKVTIGVQIDQAATADEALKQLSERMGKVSEAIRTLGIEDKNMKTLTYTIFPHYEYAPETGSSHISGYDANQQLVVKIEGINKKTDLVEKVVSEATKVGSNQLMGVAFEASNVEDLKQEARLAALLDAKTRAKTTAETMHVRLGKIIGWWDNIVYDPSLMYAEGKGGGGETSVSSGNQELRVEATVNYELKY